MAESTFYRKYSVVVIGWGSVGVEVGKGGRGGWERPDSGSRRTRGSLGLGCPSPTTPRSFRPEDQMGKTSGRRRDFSDPGMVKVDGRRTVVRVPPTSGVGRLI